MNDTGRKKTVVTVISRSNAPARTGQNEAALIAIYGLELGRKYNVDRPAIVIGRSTKADIQIDQEAVSRNHCKIINSESGVVVRDMGSTNGTFVNDEPIRDDEYILRDGDFVKVGRCIFKFLSGSNIENAYHEEIYRLTTIDGLTQVFNKRYFEETLERELGRAQRYRRDLSLIMFDIDHFKKINDGHGHLAGDTVLRTLAALVRGRIRREDIMARYGGEEFAIILPEIDAQNALQFAEKVRRLVEVGEFKFEQKKIAVTISIGVTSVAPGVANLNDFIGQCDSKLYQAKEQGRNRVVG